MTPKEEHFKKVQQWADEHRYPIETVEDFRTVEATLPEEIKAPSPSNQGGVLGFSVADLQPAIQGHRENEERERSLINASEAVVQDKLRVNFDSAFYKQDEESPEDPEMRVFDEEKYVNYIKERAKLEGVPVETVEDFRKFELKIKNSIGRDDVHNDKYWDMGVDALLGGVAVPSILHTLGKAGVGALAGAGDNLGKSVLRESLGEAGAAMGMLGAEYVAPENPLAQIAGGLAGGFTGTAARNINPARIAEAVTDRLKGAPVTASVMDDVASNLEHRVMQAENFSEATELAKKHKGVVVIDRNSHVVHMWDDQKQRVVRSRSGVEPEAVPVEPAQIPESPVTPIAESPVEVSAEQPVLPPSIVDSPNTAEATVPSDPLPVNSSPVVDTPLTEATPDIPAEVPRSVPDSVPSVIENIPAVRGMVVPDDIAGTVTRDEIQAVTRAADNFLALKKIGGGPDILNRIHRLGAGSPIAEGIFDQSANGDTLKEITRQIANEAGVSESVARGVFYHLGNNDKALGKYLYRHPKDSSLATKARDFRHVSDVGLLHYADSGVGKSGNIHSNVGGSASGEKTHISSSLEGVGESQGNLTRNTPDAGVDPLSKGASEIPYTDVNSTRPERPMYPGSAEATGGTDSGNYLQFMEAKANKLPDVEKDNLLDKARVIADQVTKKWTPDVSKKLGSPQKAVERLWVEGDFYKSIDDMSLDPETLRDVVPGLYRERIASIAKRLELPEEFVDYEVGAIESKLKQASSQHSLFDGIDKGKYKLTKTGRAQQDYQDVVSSIGSSRKAVRSAADIGERSSEEVLRDAQPSSGMAGRIDESIDNAQKLISDARYYDEAESLVKSIENIADESVPGRMRAKAGKVLLNEQYKKASDELLKNPPEGGWTEALLNSKRREVATSLYKDLLHGNAKPANVMEELHLDIVRNVRKDGDIDSVLAKARENLDLHAKKKGASERLQSRKVKDSEAIEKYQKMKGAQSEAHRGIYPDENDVDIERVGDDGVGAVEDLGDDVQVPEGAEFREGIKETVEDLEEVPDFGEGYSVNGRDISQERIDGIAEDEISKLDDAISRNSEKELLTPPRKAESQREMISVENNSMERSIYPNNKDTSLKGYLSSIGVKHPDTVLSRVSGKDRSKLLDFASGTKKVTKIDKLDTLSSVWKLDKAIADEAKKTGRTLGITGGGVDLDSESFLSSVSDKIRPYLTDLSRKLVDRKAGVSSDVLSRINDIKKGTDLTARLGIGEMERLKKSVGDKNMRGLLSHWNTSAGKKIANRLNLSNDSRNALNKFHDLISPYLTHEFGDASMAHLFDKSFFVRQHVLAKPSHETAFNFVNGLVSDGFVTGKNTRDAIDKAGSLLSDLMSGSPGSSAFNEALRELENTLGGSLEDAPGYVSRLLGKVDDPLVTASSNLRSIIDSVTHKRVAEDLVENMTSGKLGKALSLKKEAGFVQIPENVPQLGGMWTSKYVASEISSNMRELPKLVRMAGQMQTIFKKGKVFYNAAAYGRNFMSNTFLSQMGGVPISYQMKNVPGVARDLRAFFKSGKLTPWLEEALSNNVIKGTRGSADFNALKPVLDMYDNIGAEGLEGALEKLNRSMTSGKLGKKTTEGYEMIEGIGRLTAYKYYREHGITRGMLADVVKGDTLKLGRKVASPEEAVKEVNKWLFDYSDVPEFVDAARKSVVPFISFPYFASKAVGRSITEGRTGIISAFAMAAAIQQGVEKLTGEHLNMDSMFPLWNVLTDGDDQRYGKSKTSEITGIPNRAGELVDNFTPGGPLMLPVEEAAGVSTFTGKSIKGKRLEHAIDTFSPKTPLNIVKYLTGKRDLTVRNIISDLGLTFSHNSQSRVYSQYGSQIRDEVEACRRFIDRNKRDKIAIDKRKKRAEKRIRKLYDKMAKKSKSPLISSGS